MNSQNHPQLQSLFVLCQWSVLLASPDTRLDAKFTAIFVGGGGTVPCLANHVTPEDQ